jgi:hypothetical protein
MSSASEVRFGQVHGPMSANPELDHWSGSGMVAEPWTGRLRTRSEGFSSGSEHVRTLEPLFKLQKKLKLTKNENKTC